MSADLLRRASDSLRESVAWLGDDDCGDAECEDCRHFRTFHAVADWLDDTARQIDNAPEWVDPATPDRVYARAHAVARAHLGVEA